MTSYLLSKRVSDFDPEAIRELVASGKRRGLIHGTAAPTGKLDTTAIRAAAAAAKQSGALRFPASPSNPAAIAKNGADVAAVSAGLRSQWMDIDPGTAAHWMQNNFVNRPISDYTINAYARDMSNGVWVATHQGVAFNDRDHLIDGQHRLSAIIKSGVTVRMMVTFGLPSQIAGSEMTTMDAVDRGRTRSVADQLKIQHGLKNGSTIAAIAASLGYLCCNERTRRLSVGQTLEIYRWFQPAMDYVISLKPKDHGLKQTGVLAAFVFAITADDAPAIRGMFAATLTGEGITSASPLGLLRAFLLSDDAKLLNRGNSRGVSEIVLHAMFQHACGLSPAALVPSTDGLDHYRFLQPERVASIAEMFSLK